MVQLPSALLLSQYGRGDHKPHIDRAKVAAQGKIPYRRHRSCTDVDVWAEKRALSERHKGSMVMIQDSIYPVMKRCVEYFRIDGSGNVDHFGIASSNLQVSRGTKRKRVAVIIVTILTTIT